MNISSRCEYACRAVLELALNEQHEAPITADHIAERRGIPEKYLVHILLQLKRAGIVKSVRGAQGGYLLARPSDSLTLLDLVQAIDGPILAPLPVENASTRALEPTWREVASAFEKILASVTIRSVLDRNSKTTMFYI